MQSQQFHRQMQATRNSTHSANVLKISDSQSVILQRVSQQFKRMEYLASVIFEQQSSISTLKRESLGQLEQLTYLQSDNDALRKENSLLSSEAASLRNQVTLLSTQNKESSRVMQSQQTLLNQLREALARNSNSEIQRLRDLATVNCFQQTKFQNATSLGFDSIKGYSLPQVYEENMILSEKYSTLRSQYYEMIKKLKMTESGNGSVLPGGEIDNDQKKESGKIEALRAEIDSLQSRLQEKDTLIRKKDHLIRKHRENEAEQKLLVSSLKASLKHKQRHFQSQKHLNELSGKENLEETLSYQVVQNTEGGIKVKDQVYLHSDCVKQDKTSPKGEELINPFETASPHKSGKRNRSKKVRQHK